MAAQRAVVSSNFLETSNCPSDTHLTQLTSTHRHQAISKISSEWSGSPQFVFRQVQLLDESGAFSQSQLRQVAQVEEDRCQRPWGCIHQAFLWLKGLKRFRPLRLRLQVLEPARKPRPGHESITTRCKCV